MEPLWEAIENCKKSLFCYEGLQDYSAEDGTESLSYFLSKGKLKEVPDINNKWWSDMKRRNEKGIITERVRLVIEPKTDYTQMELEYLKMAKSYSGDDIRIISEVDFRAFVSEGIPDFYIIDDSRVFTMNYGLKGKYLYSIETSNVLEYLDIKKKLILNSIPL